MDRNYLGIGAFCAFSCGWLVAQLMKVLLDIIRTKRVTIRSFIEAFTKSGGMPSGHSGGFVGLTTFLGLAHGFSSEVFAISLCITMIIIYDATHVRYAVGQHGEIINMLLDESGHKDKKIKIVEGHTILQAIVGSVIGLVSGLVMAAIFCA